MPFDLWPLTGRGGLTAYKTFQEQAIYQTIEELAVWLVPHVGRWSRWLRPTLGHQTLECRLRSWFAHLGHADTYQLRKKLWGEARTVLGEYL